MPVARVMHQLQGRGRTGSRLAANGLELVTLLVEASYVRQKSELLEEASRKVEATRMLLRMAKDLKLLSLGAYGYSAEQLDELGRMVFASRIRRWQRRSVGRESLAV